MKELKFRQRNGDEWHYWGFIKGQFISPIHPKIPSNQFTGLLDKNGKEIYEDDIVILTGFSSFTPIVGITETGVWFGGIPLYELIATAKYKAIDGIEVIGNVKDNPELLKQYE